MFFREEKLREKSHFEFKFCYLTFYFLVSYPILLFTIYSPQMRPSLVVSFLLLSILISEAQGIRSKKGFLPVGHHKLHVQGEVIKKSSSAIGEATHSNGDGNCAVTMKRRRISRVTKKYTQQWVPQVHEDYYGPRLHSPKHH